MGFVFIGIFEKSYNTEKHEENKSYTKKKTVL